MKVVTCNCYQLAVCVVGRVTELGRNLLILCKHSCVMNRMWGLLFTI